ncbi:MAG: TIGR03619 family F420-dependent LLM class oxidoreductase [Chloroflexota bacterium]|nr:TIGR03619 family F420-dependent LLM class oxidoreductase [Chloroflexota bacterium]
MQYGVSAPAIDEYADPRVLAELARDAEQAGWDGFFVWDHILYDNQWMPPVADPWITLAAVAANTERIRLGTLVAAVPRRRPWVLAREAATLDRLSNGRLTMGVGAGYPPDADFSQFGENPDHEVRTEKLDEGLEILAGLWTGEPFQFHGKHNHIQETIFRPTPVQSPRIPIWVAGVWPHREAFVRAARWDGVCTIKVGGPDSAHQAVELISPDDLRSMTDFVQEHRQDDSPFDVVLGGWTPGDSTRRAAEFVAPYAEAGLTWWIETVGPWRGSRAQLWKRIGQGPPRL